MTIDVIIPARDEALTVTSVVEACVESRHVRRVIVVDDGSTDGTADFAAEAGAMVIHREGGDGSDGTGGTGGGSKAHAMEAGVRASDADALCFVDADLLGFTTAHLDAILEAYVAGRGVMSIGTFDYGFWNWLVLRLPPTTGERVVPRWVFAAVPPEKREGYTIEIMLNEVVAEARLPTVARVMKDVTHRTKREKFGPVEGWRRTWRMFWDLVALARIVRLRTYWFYLRDLTIER